MSRYMAVLFRILASILAFMVMMGILLIIAYYQELYRPPQGEEPALTAITGATVINPTGAVARYNATVLISANRVWSIEPGGRAPAGANVLNVPGSVVIPMLIDSAVYFESPTGEEIDYRSGEWFWEVTRSLPDHRRGAVESGIGVIQDLAGGLDSALNTRNLLARGDLAGPLLLASGPILTAPDGCPGADRFPGRLEEVVRPISSVEDARAGVQALASRGVDLISVCYSAYGGVFSLMDDEVLSAIVQQAHGFGLRVVVETSSLEEARQAVTAGADALAGGVNAAGQQVDGELLSAMRERGAAYIPTLAAVEARQETFSQSLVAAKLNARLAHQAGVILLAGSGTAGPNMSHGASLLRELALLVEAGLTESQALRSATIDAAEFLSLPDLGILAAGKTASLMVLPRDPLEDLTALEAVQVIIQNGVVTLNRLDVR
jgi:imidazolonepropionase-like amidohydrolase